MITNSQKQFLTLETSPKTGMMIAKFQNNNDVIRIGYPKTHKIGIAGNMFEYDLGTMLGWYPLPNGLD